MTIQHVLPFQVTIADPGDWGGIREPYRTGIPGQGRVEAISWTDSELQQYDLTITEISPTTEVLAKLRKFLFDTQISIKTGWYLEPPFEQLVIPHRSLACGVGDGTKKAFVLPISGTATEVGIFVAGDLKESSDYTIKPISNLVSQQVAVPTESGLPGLIGFDGATISRESAMAPDGLYSIKCVPNAPPDAAYGVQTSQAEFVSVIVGESYTGHAAGRGDGTLLVALHWYDAAKTTLISTDAATGIAMNPAYWVTNSVTATAPAGSAYARVIGYHADFVTPQSTPVWIGCLGIHPGDLQHWFPPEQAPNVIVLAVAPLLGEAVTATATGRRLIHARRDRDSYRDRYQNTGWNVPDRLQITEEIWRG